MPWPRPRVAAPARHADPRALVDDYLVTTGERTGSISLTAQTDGVRLLYQVTGGTASRRPSTSSSASPTRRPSSAAAGSGWYARAVRGRAASSMVGATSVAGFAIACATRPKASKRTSVPQTGLARSPSAFTTCGVGPPRPSTTSHPSRPACAGRRTTALRCNMTNSKTGGRWV
jgi:hypothetical protein